MPPQLGVPRLKAPPVAAPGSADWAGITATADEYRRVVLEGRYLDTPETLTMAVTERGPGFWVLAPFRAEAGFTVLVNRGFVPYDRKDPATRREGEVAGTAAITGLARNPLTEKPSALVPDNEPAKNVFYWKDRDAMASSAGLDPAKLVPFFIDAGAAPNPGGLPIGGVTIVDLPNNHLQYALTWYGLAAALAAIFGTWLWRRRQVHEFRH